MEKYEIKEKLSSLQRLLGELRTSLAVDELIASMETLNAAILAPDFWDDTEKAQETMVTFNETKDTVEHYSELVSQLGDMDELFELLDDAEFEEEKSGFEADLAQ